jgi:hypothetical protein
MYVCHLAILPPSTMRTCISGSLIIPCWIWPNRAQSSPLESTPIGVGRVSSDHRYERRDILGAMLTGEVIRLLELLLHVIPADARVWVDRY